MGGGLHEHCLPARLHGIFALGCEPRGIGGHALNCSSTCSLLLAPIFIISVVLAILGNFVQIGFLVSGEPLKMKLSKLNPIEGFKRIFSMRALIEFLKSSA